MIQKEQEVCRYLSIPSIPKKKWDGKSSFKFGVAVTELLGGGHSYAVATFDAERDTSPRITRTFSDGIFTAVGDVFIVPSYMDTDVSKMDLDEDSKEAARLLVEEAKELETEGVSALSTLPENEYLFEHIHNDDEAIAFIRSYNRANGIKGKVPTNHERITMRLSVIWSEKQKEK